MRFSPAVLATVALAVAGCATSSDPSEGGFISGVKGVTTGEYDRRVEERKRGVSKATEDRDALAADVKDTERQIRANQAEISRLRRDLNSLKVTIASNLARIKHDDRVLSEREKATVAAGRTSLRGNPDPAKIEDLRKAVSAARDLAERLANINSG